MFVVIKHILIWTLWTLKWTNLKKKFKIKQKVNTRLDSAYHRTQMIHVFKKWNTINFGPFGSQFRPDLKAGPKLEVQFNRDPYTYAQVIVRKPNVSVDDNDDIRHILIRPQIINMKIENNFSTYKKISASFYYFLPLNFCYK